jgi:hypothetical protein
MTKRTAPVCVGCEKPLRSVPVTIRGEAGWRGWGWNGRGHFCSRTCAAEWAENKVLGTAWNCDDPRDIDNAPFRAVGAQLKSDGETNGAS